MIYENMHCESAGNILLTCMLGKMCCLVLHQLRCLLETPSVSKDSNPDVTEHMVIVFLAVFFSFEMLPI